MRKLSSLAACYSLLFLLPGAHAGQASSLSEKNAIHASGRIHAVVDGDTLIVNFSKEDYQKFKRFSNNRTSRNLKDKYNSVKIRLGSVDAPESVHSQKSKNTAKGREASKYLKSWAEKKPATVSCYDIGYYGRFICNVKVNNQRDIGLAMIEAGYSDYVTKWGKNPYMDKEYRAADKNN